MLLPSPHLPPVFAQSLSRFRLSAGSLLLALLLVFLARCAGAPREEPAPDRIEGGVLDGENGEAGREQAGVDPAGMDPTDPGERIAETVREAESDQRVHAVLLGNIALVGVERGENLQAERSAPPSPDGEEDYVPSHGRTGILPPAVVQAVRREHPYVARVYSTDDPYLTQRIAEAAAAVTEGRPLEDLTRLAELAENLDGFGSRFPSDGEQRREDEEQQRGSPTGGRSTPRSR